MLLMSEITHASVEASLLELIQDEFLDGDDELTTATPLLEWGVLKSIELARLVAFVKDEFGVRIPSSMTVADNMQNVGTIAGLVIALADDAQHPNQATA
jgi:acyl carrier protein